MWPAQKSSRAMRGPCPAGGIAGLGMVAVSTVAVGIGSTVGRSPAEAPAEAFGLRRLRSRWSQRRMVSRPILMPISPKPMASVSAESPASASRSNSSRCGSSCAVAWLRGCRDWATAWASVVGRGVVGGEWMGNDMVLDGPLYAWWSGRARGAPRAHSKRKRLDVGVLPYFFVLFLLGNSACFLSSCIGSFIRLVDCLDFGFGILVELVSLDLWFHRFSVHFSAREVLGFVCPSSVVGGGGC